MRDWREWVQRLARLWSDTRPYRDVDRYGLRQLKWGFAAAAAVWIVLWGLVLLPGQSSGYGFRSNVYRAASEECSGSYASRYECKSRLIIDGENRAFYDWFLRLALIFGPPLGLLVYFRRIQQRREREAAEESRRRARQRLAT